MKTKIKELDFYMDLAEVFEKYQEQEMAVFLDSSLNCPLGKYSVIGLNPYYIVKELDGVVVEKRIAADGFTEVETVSSESFEQVVKDYCLKNVEENVTGLPLIAGAIGYLSYDYGRKFEQIETRHPKQMQVPDALFVFYDLLIMEDKENKKLYITARGELGDAQVSIRRLEGEIQEVKKSSEELKKSLEELKKSSEELNKPSEKMKNYVVKGNPEQDTKQKNQGVFESEKIPLKRDRQSTFWANFEKEDYEHTIEKMISYIVEGDIYIANMTQQLRVESGRDPYDVYRYLRTYNPSPFGGYFNYGDFQILCASPERFIQVRDGRIETRPIKGTRKRGRTKAEDKKMAQELRDSEKEQSELLMIVDLERNDLSRICEAGSVQVPELFAIEKYATVFHMVSTVEGTLKRDVHAMDVITSVFPGGSITGAPKIRAMEIIDELEHDRRGIYTGCIGYISFDGNCDFNIVIRTALYQNGIYYMGVGGGITCESEPEFEYEETLQKAGALLEAMAEERESAGGHGIRESQCESEDESDIAGILPETMR